MAKKARHNDYPPELDEIQRLVRSLTRGMDRLLALSRSRNAEVRLRAIEAIGEIASEGSLARVRAATTDRSELVRVTALEILGDWKDRTSEDACRARLRDRSALVRGYAAMALGDMGATDLVPTLERQRQRAAAWERVCLSYALVKLGKRRHLTDLLQALDHDAYIVRCIAAHLAAEVADRRSRTRIRRGLTAALEREETVAARSSIEGALDELRSTRKSPVT